MPLVEFDLSSLRRRDFDKAKAVLVEIIAAAGGTYRGKTKLYKAFWLAHLYHWRDELGQLTSFPIVCLPKGPGIDDGDDLLNALVADGTIEIEVGRAGPFPEYCYTMRNKFAVDPASPVHRSASKAVEFLKDKTAAEISDLAHEASRSWRSSTNGQVLDIYLDLLSDSEFKKVATLTAEADEVWRAANSG